MSEQQEMEIPEGYELIKDGVLCPSDLIWCLDGGFQDVALDAPHTTSLSHRVDVYIGVVRRLT